MVLKIGRYAITISPKPNYSRFTDRQNFFDHTITFRKWFKKIANSYILYPEFDDKFRLHYHGVIHVKDPGCLYRFIKFCNKNIGFVKVDINQIHLEWIIYMSKEWGITKDILKISDPLTHFSKITYNEQHTRCDIQIHPQGYTYTDRKEKTAHGKSIYRNFFPDDKPTKKQQRLANEIFNA